MDTNNKQARLPDWIKSGWLLGAFALVFIFSLSTVYEMTKKRIKMQERLRLKAQLSELLVNKDSFDNRPCADMLKPADSDRIIYRVRKQDEPIAVIIKTQAPDGYSGSIQLLVGIQMDGKLLGVRALKHKETPGLGDEINLNKSDWVLDFNQRSLEDPKPEQWAVKRDGGIFDSFTGATITPRAVVGEVKKTLIYFQNHKSELFQ